MGHDEKCVMAIALISFMPTLIVCNWIWGFPEGVGRARWIEEMKPEEFPVRCGQLLKDESFPDYPSSLEEYGFASELEYRNVTVEMTQADGRKDAVTAEYVNGAWNKAKPVWDLLEIGNYKVRDAGDRKILRSLYPCLQKPDR